MTSRDSTSSSTATASGGGHGTIVNISGDEDYIRLGVGRNVDELVQQMGLVSTRLAP